MELHPSITSTKTKNAFNKIPQRFYEAHKDRYDYSNFVYEGSRIPGIIICKEHGEFKQNVDNHSMGKGCPTCGGKAAASKVLSSTTKFKQSAYRVHGDKFEYTRVNYVTARQKVEIYCKEHGGYFWQTPTGHLGGKGCRQCADKANTKTTAEFIAASIRIHGDKYCYTNTVYTQNKNKILIHCNSCNREFEQVASSHLRGKGCIYCGSAGFNPGKPGILYYFKVTDGINTAWKIGITNKSVKFRYSSQEYCRMSGIVTKLFDLGQDAYDEEQRILKQYKQYKYTGPKLLVSGNTELFHTDLLNLKETTWI